MKNLLKNILKRKELLFLVFLIIIGGFLRIYRLEELMTYLGDEGRDMLIVMDILKAKNFPLIGPPTSVGELYLGPIYYYFISPFAWIFKMNPVGPAVFVVLLGVLTIPLVYFTAKNFFDSVSAYFSAICYTVSPMIVKFSRSSWNPNPMPFFALLLMLFLFYWQKTRKAKFLYLSSISFAIMLQLHYMVILMAPFLCFAAYKIGKDFKCKKTFIYASLIFLFLMSPLLIFDLKHGFVNFKGFLEIYRERSVSGFSLYDILSRSRDRLRQLFSLVLGFSEREWKTNLTVLVILIFSLFNWYKVKKPAKVIFYGYAIWGILVLGFYRQSVHSHYLGFLFPLPIILLGSTLSKIFKKGNFGKLISLGLLIVFLFNMGKKTWLYLSRSPVLNVGLVKKIVFLIKKESNNNEFNFALLARNNYDASYRYFFKLWNIPAVYQTEVSDQLFVVCEDPDICFPEGNPKWEIALFDAAYNGQIKKAGEWQPDPLIKVFRFIPKKK